MYTTSSRKQTVNIITFAQFAERGLVENKRNVAEDESISTLIEYSYIDNDSDGGSIITNYLGNIWG